MPISEMTQIELIPWLEKYCDNFELSEDIKQCLEERGNQNFDDLVLAKSHNVTNKVDVQHHNGVVQFITLNNNSIPFDWPTFYLALEPKFQYTILFIDPAFKFLTPNPLTAKKTTLRLSKRANSILIYFQVCSRIFKHYIVFHFKAVKHLKLPTKEYPCISDTDYNHGSCIEKKLGLHSILNHANHNMK